MTHFKMKILILFLFFPFFLWAKKNPIVIPKIEPGKPMPADLFIQIGKKINPSVVNISITAKMRQRMTTDFFIFPYPFERPLPQKQNAKPTHSVGSGFILEPDGHIVTNAHVVSRASDIRVQFKDDPVVYNAKIVGLDTATDIALIKISTKDSRTKKTFPAVQLGDSNALQVGEWVAAFGNPYSHSNTMTKGIISAIDRHIDDLNLLPFLQTDASINPGNSGGPLVNTQGEVVGVNTAINPRAQNIGFAIPIHNVQSILKSLKKYGYVKRGFLGVQMRKAPAIFDYNKKSYQGVFIVDVVPGSPAAKSKLQMNDIIIEFNGSPIKTSNDLYKIVSATPVNEKVQGKLFRNNRIQNFTVVVKERQRQAALSSHQKSSGKAPFHFGFQLTQPSSPIPHHLNLPWASASRPVVSQVSPSSPAQKAGLRKGDLIVNVNGENVSNIEGVFKRLSPTRKNVLHVLRWNPTGSYNLKKIMITK